MARIVPFECPLTEREKEIQEIITRSGLPVPDVYWHRKYMTDIAVRVQTAFNEKMVFLPFCFLCSMHFPVTLLPILGM